MEISELFITGIYVLLGLFLIYILGQGIYTYIKIMESFTYDDEQNMFKKLSLDDQNKYLNMSDDDKKQFLYKHL